MSSLIFTFIEYRISMIFLLLFMIIFMPLQYSKVKTAFICVGCFALTGLLEYIDIMYQVVGLGSVVITFFEIIIVQATALLLCRYRDCRAVFTGITAADYVLIGNMIYAMIQINLGTYVIPIIITIIVHTLILILLISMLRYRFISELESRAKGWGLLMIIPALFYCTVYTLAIWPSNIYSNSTNELAVVLVLVLMVLIYIMIVTSFYVQRAEGENRGNLEFLRTYSNGLKREIEAVKQLEETTALMRHDMRHEYMLISTYLDAGETDKIYELINKLNEDLEVSKRESFCDNISINGILNLCSQKAKDKHVKFICKADVPETLENFNEFELATVISNLLDNAIEAASLGEEDSNSMVSIKVFPVKNQLLLEVTNTFVGEYEFSQVSGLPLSRKGEGHGYGLRSVKTFADKKNALFQCGVENGLFRVKLMTNI